MRVLLAIVLCLAVGAETADARKRRHHGHRHDYAQADRLAVRSDLSRSGRRSEIAALIPRDWQLEPAAPNWQGKRFSSPAGDAWLDFYVRSAQDVRREQHLKEVAFADGEQITYLHGERDWLAVSGLRGNRIFYRKAILACGDRQWRHIAFEYPADAKQNFDRLVTRMSHALDRARDEECNLASAPTADPD